MNDHRTKIWVDQFQTRVVRRLGLYLGLYVVGLVNFLFIGRLLTEGAGDPVQQLAGVFVDYAPVFISLAVLVPVMAYDGIRFTHRLVGPLVRIRTALRAIAGGEQVRRVKLREDDFLHEMAAEFNEALEAVHKQGVPVLKPNDGQDDAQRQPA